MADIDVERKEGTPIWPWIVGLLVLALLAWLLFSLLDRDEDPTAVGVMPVDTLAEGMPAAPVAGGPPAAGDVLQQYQQQCTGAEGEMGLDHQFVANCLRQLADAADTALSRPSGAGVEARGELEEVRRRAQELEQSPPDATNHAALASGAFTSAAALIERMQSPAYPDLASQASEVRSAATGLQAQGDLLQQRDQVHAFFQEAGEALQAMLMAPAQP